MNQCSKPPPKKTPPDQDLVEQARPGHGIPSQDPNPAAQQQLSPEEADREADSVLAGGGTILGAAAGAAVGTLVAGPVGTLLGVAVGALAGALGGVAVGPLVSDGEPRPEPAASTKPRVPVG